MVRELLRVDPLDWQSTLSAYGLHAAVGAWGVIITLALVFRARRRRLRAAPAASSHVRASTIAPPPETAPPVPRIVYDDSEGEVDDEHTDVSPAASQTTAPKIFYEEDAYFDEPTGARPLIMLTATAQSHVGQKRKRNEDSVLVLEGHGLFAVADGMGGVTGGDVASSLAVDTLRSAFEKKAFVGDAPPELPRRAAELVRAIAMANNAVIERARAARELKGMGTTLTAARFAARKQRLYIGHVGDSRLYRWRRGRLAQLTSDHTMAELGIGGDESKNLSRALGIWPRVPVDLVMAKPLAGDIYLICSDGLTKMIDEDRLARMIAGASSIDESARALVDAANISGGTDNISVVLVRVDAPSARNASVA